MKPESNGNPVVDLIIRGMGRLMPVDYLETVSEEEYLLLKRRSRWLNGISQALWRLAFLGRIFLPLPQKTFTGLLSRGIIALMLSAFTAFGGDRLAGNAV